MWNYSNQLAKILMGVFSMFLLVQKGYAINNNF